MKKLLVVLVVLIGRRDRRVRPGLVFASYNEPGDINVYASVGWYYWPGGLGGRRVRHRRVRPRSRPVRLGRRGPRRDGFLDRRRRLCRAAPWRPCTSDSA